MFGFLRPQSPIARWRQSYARICQHQRELFGLTSLPFLSYEATFLYQLAIDFGLIHSLPTEAPTCCRLRKIRHEDDRHDQDAATFAASFGMLLAGIKLADDVEDRGHWPQRLMKWKYRRPVQQATNILEEHSPGLADMIDCVLRDHAEIEGTKGISLEEYAVPTGRGFEAIFSAFDRRVGTSDSSDLAAIGAAIGRSIIAWDCAVDFDTDRIRGDFNPLTDHLDVRNSLDYCRLQLARIGWMLPKNSTSGHVIQDVIGRVLRQRESSAMAPLRRLERWGLVREKNHTYAKCDGLEVCCLAGDCVQCLGAAECCVCIDCIPCWHVDGPCNEDTNRNKSKNVQSSSEVGPYEWCHGRDVTTTEPLNPSGYITIDDQKIPAKTASGNFLDSGVRCRVVRTDPYGVSVEPV